MVSGPHMWCVKWLEWNSKQWAIADLRHNLNDRSLGDRCWFNWHTVWKCMHQNSSYNYIRFKSSVAAQVLVSNTHFWCFYWPNTIFVISIFFRSFIYLMNDERHQPPEHKLTHTHAHIRYQLFCLDSVILSRILWRIATQSGEIQKAFCYYFCVIIVLMQLAIISM